jgi:hypothetical protein
MATSQEIEEKFLTVKNCLRVTMAQFMLMAHHPKPTDDLSEQALEVLEKFGLTLPLARHFLDDQDRLMHSQEQSIFTLLRAALVWAHELSKSISKESARNKMLFEAAPFALVSWLLRDSWGHDLKLRFSESQRKQLPACWRDIALTDALVGQVPSTRDVPVMAVYALIEAHEQLCIDMCSA